MMEETTNLLEEQIQNNLRNVKKYSYEDEKGGKVRTKILSETNTLLEKLTAIEKDNMEYWDKEKRREIEQEKNETMASIEQEKQHITWQRVGFEMAKVAVPVVLGSIFSLVLHSNTMKFEESGTYTSWSSRHLPTPKIFK